MEATCGERRTSPAILAKGSFCSSSSSVGGFGGGGWLVDFFGDFFFVWVFSFFLFLYSRGPEGVVWLAHSSEFKRQSGCIAREPVLSRA